MNKYTVLGPNITIETESKDTSICSITDLLINSFASFEVNNDDIDKLNKILYSMPDYIKSKKFIRLAVKTILCTKYPDVKSEYTGLTVSINTIIMNAIMHKIVKHENISIDNIDGNIFSIRDIAIELSNELMENGSAIYFISALYAYHELHPDIDLGEFETPEELYMSAKNNEIDDSVKLMHLNKVAMKMIIKYVDKFEKEKK